MGAGAAEQDAQGAPPGVRIVADVAGAFSYASYQNAVPVLRALTLVNATRATFEGCRLELAAVPPFLRPRVWNIDRLLPGDELAASDRRLELDPAYLAGLDEAERGEVRLVLRQGAPKGGPNGGRILAEARHPVRLLARDEWGGVADMAQLLPAFVMPNDPAVAPLLRGASEKLAKHGFPPGLDGYQSGDPARVRLMVAALYATVAERDLHYAEPPASFELRGQKVRRPSVIASTGLATCLDSALLFAALFEGAGLNPVLLMFEGHAAVGVWLKKRTLPDAVVASPMELRKAIAAREFMALETTGVTRRPVRPVGDAEAALLIRLTEEREARFRAAIDVARLRAAGIAPLASHQREPEPVPTVPPPQPAAPAAPPPRPARPPLPPLRPKPTPPRGPAVRPAPPRAAAPTPAPSAPAAAPSAPANTAPANSALGKSAPAKPPPPAPGPRATQPPAKPIELPPVVPKAGTGERRVGAARPAPAPPSQPVAVSEPVPEPVAPVPEAAAPEPPPEPGPMLVELVAPEPEHEPAPLPLEEKPTTPEGRIQRWQKKLLDLTLRNRLLNFKDTKKTVPFLCTDVGALEDRLSGGAGIRIISAPDHNPLGERDAEIYREMRGQDLNRAFAADALERNELPSPLPGGQLEARLIDLYREAKNDLAEGGANTLFLAVGFLRWRRAGEGKDYRAPLLLVPVRLERVAASAEFKLRFHEDEPRFNATLLKFLESEFDLALPQLAGELPRDGKGIDVERLLAEVRRAVREVPHMEVVDDAALATFSFAKFLMWKDLVERTDLLRQNRVVRHLIDCPETAFPGAEAPAPKEEDIDRAYAPADVVSLLPADSSQQVASLMAAEGHDMVIVGPPGTGKSQTIANMIAHCLAVGKTVLFVAEKSAALNVVYRRLREHGLGPHCLELHSSKADRKHFIEQLKASWEQGAAGDDDIWVAANERLKVKRDQLNAYVAALHRPHANGLSAYEALGRVLKGAEAFAPRLVWSHPEVHDAPTRAMLEELADEIGRTFAAVAQQPVLGLVDAQSWSNAWQQGLVAASVTLKTAAETLASAFDAFLEALGLPSWPEAPEHRIAGFARLATAVEACAGEDHSIVFDADFDQLLPALRTLEAEIEAAQVVETALAGRFAEADILRIPVDQLLDEWRDASAAVWPVRLARQAKVRRVLASYARNGAQAEPREALPLLARMQGYLAEIETSKFAGRWSRFAGLDTDTAGLRAWIERAGALRAAFFALGLPSAGASMAANSIGPVVTGEGDPYRVREAGARLRSARADFTAAAQAFAGAAGCTVSALVGDRALADVAGTMADLLAARALLADWTTWRSLRRKALGHGLGALVEALEEGTLDAEEAGGAFRLAYARWWLPLAMDADPVLRGFRRFQHEHVIADFRDLDDLVRAHAAERVRQRIAHRLPPAQGVPRNSELGLLRHQMELQRPSRSIREMIGAMPETFPRLAPCMLMSPLSIAQYLPPGQALFDVVIFDEASQITTWDAVGAIARGRQTVIVGDPKQLPPTNFFGRNEEDDETLADYERDLESILDEAKASGLPVRDLRWHYRSRHESLIAFSNWHYYANRLITFPSPEVEDKAVTLRPVPNGVYDRGRSRTNLIEARAVAEAAVARMRGWLALPERTRPTLAVITFNAQQQALIQDLLDKARQDVPEIEWFFSDDRFEPTIVKNLENVQGDERDVIFFSVTYARDAAGVRRMEFGALNREGGERRLNVAVTRARQELVVFSGTGADDIDLSRTRSTGARHLKAFLDFAARGAVALPGQEQGSKGGPESPFEAAVAEALQALGWEVVPQVGVSGFRVDLGIRHPGRAGRFLAGIECDGATYYRAATARDRDKVREEVLRSLGWKILRVWSTDWWHDHAGAVQRLDAALRALAAERRGAPGEGLADAPVHWELGEAVNPAPEDDSAEPAPAGAPGQGAGQPAALPAPSEAGMPAGAPESSVPDAGAPATSDEDLPDAPVDADVRPPSAPLVPDGDPSQAAGDPPDHRRAAPDDLPPRPNGPLYRLADLTRFAPDPKLFFSERYGPRLAAMVEEVLAWEAPVREDILAQRIARAHGRPRTGQRIKAQIARHLIRYERTRESSGDFIWRSGTVAMRLPFREPEDAAARRTAGEIPLAELAFLVETSPEILAESDPVLALARRLGIDRLTSVTRPRLQEAVDLVLQERRDAKG